MDYLYKIEIELDDEKIVKDGKYDLENVYATIRSWFAEEHISEVKTNEHMLVFASTKDDEKELARFGLVEGAFLDDKLLMQYVLRMTWYDKLSGSVSKENVLEVARKHGLL